MDSKNDDKKLESYEQEIDESKLSNPFSNALKSLTSLLQKMHLINPSQTLIGDKDTNSRGFQTTSKDPFSATDKKSLKAILRTAFNDLQNKRAEKLQAKNSVNTMAKQTIGGQSKTTEQTPIISNTPTQEFIRPLTAAEKAAMRTQQAPNLINNTVVLAETIVEPDIEQDTSIDAGEIDVDKDFNNKEKSGIEATTINIEKQPVSEQNIQPKNRIISGTVRKETKPTVEKDEPEL